MTWHTNKSFVENSLAFNLYDLRLNTSSANESPHQYVTKHKLCYELTHQQDLEDGLAEKLLDL